MKKGFTLIELLIVIAILGSLAAIVLIALNPAQQLARARDASRIAEVTEVGHSLEVYTTDKGSYVPEAATWIDTLVAAGAIQLTPGSITYTMPNTTFCVSPATLSANSRQNNICYDATAAAGTGPAVVYARMESASQIGKCPVTAPNPTWTYAVYSTADGRTGIVCRAQTVAAPTAANVVQPVPGLQTFQP